MSRACFFDILAYMKIILTGGSTGGHFYPLIAVAEEIRRLAKKEHILEPELFFLSNTSFDEGILYDNRIAYKYVPAGKLRMYFSLRIIPDAIATFFGILKAIITVYKIYPDVIFSKGGFASFPTLFAAKILKIPVIIHDSDTSPGRVSKWSAKFAERIAVSWPEAQQHFDNKEKVAWTGNPVRDEIKLTANEGAYEFLGLTKEIPTLLIIGGSQGAQFINDQVMSMLPELLQKYQVIHQTGKDNFSSVEGESKVVLEGVAAELTMRYKPYGYLNNLAMKMSAGASDLVITRAGSSLFEIALWGIPSIIIPISISHDDHQRKNAYSYARTGAAIVVEENNVTPNILLNEVDRILNSKKTSLDMRTAALNFSKPQAAETIATEILEIALTHEK